MHERPASKMTGAEIVAELTELGAKWDEMRSELEECGGMSGSPGEWMWERMNELETEIAKRDKLEVPFPSTIGL